MLQNHSKGRRKHEKHVEKINQVKRCLQEMTRVFYAERRVLRAKRRFMVIDGNCPPPGQMITISESILVIFKGLVTFMPLGRMITISQSILVWWFSKDWWQFMPRGQMITFSHSILVIFKGLVTIYANGQMITISQSILVIFKELVTIYATGPYCHYFPENFGDF